MVRSIRHISTEISLIVDLHGTLWLPLCWLPLWSTMALLFARWQDDRMAWTGRTEKHMWTFEIVCVICFGPSFFIGHYMDSIRVICELFTVYYISHVDLDLICINVCAELLTIKCCLNPLHWRRGWWKNSRTPGNYHC